MVPAPQMWWHILISFFNKRCKGDTLGHFVAIFQYFINLSINWENNQQINDH